jgi:hypothetical protein
LGDQGYAPRVDLANLKPGDEWRRVLDAWITDCQAAVAILDKEALDSAWVAYEVSILSYEHRIREQNKGPGVALLVVLDGITTADLEASELFDPIAVPSRQLVELKPGADIEEAADQIASAFGPLANQVDDGVSPFDKQAALLGDRLCGITKTKIDRADEDIALAWDGAFDPILDPWALRVWPDRLAAAAARWLLRHALVTRPPKRSTDPVTSEPSAVLDHLQPEVEADTVGDELIDNLFAGWYPTVVTGELVRTGGGAYVYGGRADLPFSEFDIGRRCFWAAVVRSTAGARYPAPWIQLTNPMGLEDATPDELRQRVDRAARKQLGQEVAGLSRGSRVPVGVAFGGEAADPQLDQVLDRVHPDLAAGPDDAENPEPLDDDDLVLEDLSYVMLWGNDSDRGCPIGIAHGLSDVGDRFRAEAELLAAFEDELADLVRQTAEALQPPALRTHRTTEEDHGS